MKKMEGGNFIPATKNIFLYKSRKIKKIKNKKIEIATIISSEFCNHLHTLPMVTGTYTYPIHPIRKLDPEMVILLCINVYVFLFFLFSHMLTRHTKITQA